MTVLITRPLAAAKRTEYAFQLAGHSTWIDPVLTILPLPAHIDPSAYDAFITTSGNGVESLAELTQNRDTPIFCAGSASGAIAREHGFTSVFYPEEPGAKELISLLKKSSYTRFAYIRGEVVKIDIAHALADVPGAHIDSYCTYKAIPTTTWTDETVALFHAQKITAITFYSEHSAHVTLNLLSTHNLLEYTASINALCLSAAIADIVQAHSWKEISARW